jgi:hypothetical protein
VKKHPLQYGVLRQSLGYEATSLNTDQPRPQARNLSENCCAGRGIAPYPEGLAQHAVLYIQFCFEVRKSRGVFSPIHNRPVPLSESVSQYPPLYSTPLLSQKFNVRMSRSRPFNHATMWIFVSTPRSRPIQPHGCAYNSNVLSRHRPSEYPTPHFGHLTSLLYASLPTTEP